MSSNTADYQMVSSQIQQLLQAKHRCLVGRGCPMGSLSSRRVQRRPTRPLGTSTSDRIRAAAGRA